MMLARLLASACLAPPGEPPAPFATPPAAVVAPPPVALAEAPIAPAATPMPEAGAVPAEALVEKPVEKVAETPIVPVEPKIPLPSGEAAALSAADLAAQEAARSLISAAKGKIVDVKAPAGAPDKTKEIPAPAAAGETPAVAAPAEAAKVEAQPPVPTVYEAFKFPDGVKFDDAKLKATFLDLIAPHNVPQAVAQKLLDNLVEEIQRVVAATRKEPRDYYNGLVAKWKDETRKDPRLANRLDTALANSKALVETYAITREDSDAILRQFDANGMGSFPPFVRMFDRLGEMLNVLEDGIVPPAAPVKASKNGRGWYDDVASPKT